MFSDKSAFNNIQNTNSVQNMQNLQNQMIQTIQTQTINSINLSNLNHEIIEHNFGDFVVLDLETTGLSPFYHKIIEIAALRYSNGKLVENYSTLINPKTPIPHFITRLTGINNRMVEGKPELNEVLPKVKDILSGAHFVGHNVGFDYGFMDYAYKKHFNSSLSENNTEKICTCRLARRLLPELPSKKLGHLCEHFQIKNSEAHRAMGDTIATAKLFSGLLTMMRSSGVNTDSIEEILNFQKSKIPRI